MDLDEFLNETVIQDAETQKQGQQQKVKEVQAFPVQINVSVAGQLSPSIKQLSPASPREQLQLSPLTAITSHNQQVLPQASPKVQEHAVRLEDHKVARGSGSVSLPPEPQDPSGKNLEIVTSKYDHTKILYGRVVKNHMRILSS